MQSISKTSSHIEINQNDWIPEGFIKIIGPRNEEYIVPEFMVNQLDQDYHTNTRKVELGVSMAPGVVSLFFDINTRSRSKDRLQIPVTKAGYCKELQRPVIVKTGSVPV